MNAFIEGDTQYITSNNIQYESLIEALRAEIATLQKLLATSDREAIEIIVRNQKTISDRDYELAEKINHIASLEQSFEIIQEYFAEIHEVTGIIDGAFVTTGLSSNRR